MNSTVSEGRVGGSNESAAGVLATELPAGRGAWRDAGPAGGDAGGSACLFHDGGQDSGRRRRAVDEVKPSTAAVGSEFAAG